MFIGQADSVVGQSIHGERPVYSRRTPSLFTANAQSNLKLVNIVVYSMNKKESSSSKTGRHNNHNFAHLRLTFFPSFLKHVFLVSNPCNWVHL